jgi:hypothetical protein
MTTGNYRVRKRRLNADEIMFGLAQVYETANGAGFTERWMAPVAVCSPDDPDANRKAIIELQDQLIGMLDALSKPILEDNDTFERPEPPLPIVPAGQ